MKALRERKILVPVDFSDASFDAVEVACEIASDESNVIVVHVLEVHEHHDLLANAVDESKRRNHAQEVLREAFESAKHTLLDVEIRFGDPGSRIAELAHSRHAELIVMPSRGRTGAKRLLLGSVTERVLRLAHCPVLVLRDTGARTYDAKEVA